MRASPATISIDARTPNRIRKAVNEKKAIEVVKSRVLLKELDEKKIEEYVNTGEALDKAGAYDVAGTYGRFLIEKIDGEVDAIRGLPIKKLSEMIKTVTE